ncbi:MAG: DUF4258 domain-containing protein [Gammaproteobacteria bacterium]|nr:DUF4258 domain-containing protein [Gammaproteobacteria bacterium]MBU1655752.1 DUF4258 domain-containing protein [Gammaproteobacteria bacterium]MBU1959929.1 DUF4258 domain-containing protein [Gammaproteobacteria bacterium]
MTTAMRTEQDLQGCLAADCRIEWRKHVLERMLGRGITRAEVLATLRLGEMITAYPHDRPVPSALLHAVRDPPLHVVVALDSGCSPPRIVIHVSSV